MSFAIIDAAAGADPRDCGYAARSRYSTPIANLPLIYHVFDELAASGVDRARVVTGAAARAELERLLVGGRSWGIDVYFAEAGDGDGRRAMLSELEQALSDEPVLVYPGDCLFPGQVAAMWERFGAGDVDAVVLGADAGTADAGAGAARESVRLSSVPAILGAHNREALDELRHDGVERRDLAEWLRGRGWRMAECEPAAHWRYSDATDDLLTANRMMLDALAVPALDGSFGNENHVHGRVAISPSARVSGCTLHGPLAIADAAVVEDSFVGPYTAIGAHAVLSGTEIDDTMVLARAEIRHPGQRIAASIIGERASVVRSFALPRGLHLRLEPDSRVILS